MATVRVRRIGEVSDENGMQARITSERGGGAG